MTSTAPRYERFSLPVLVAYTIVLVDQGTKAIASSPAVADDALSRNRGVLAGMGGNTPGLVVVLSIGALVLLLAVIARSIVRLGVPAWIPAIFAAGAIGNTLDRVRLGSVRDFIATPWLIVNVADIAIVVGVVATTIAVAVRLHALHRNGDHIWFDVRHLRTDVASTR